MKDPEFNLLDEPWIPVRLLDGSVVEIGLLELLRRTTEIADLACELPTQSIAIQRLLLAIAMLCVGSYLSESSPMVDVLSLFAIPSVRHRKPTTR